MAAAHVGPIGCLSALLSLVMLDRARVESPGIRRLVLSLPYIVLCQTLVSLIPQDQIVLRLILAGQYAWWSTFKVIAFVCNRGPLLEIPTSRPVFFVVLLLPVSPLRQDGSKKRKIEQQGKGPAKKPAAAKKKKPAKEKLTHKDAMEYLTKVKERFNDKLTVYNKFLDIMRKFGMKKINTAGVVELVKTLFKGHKDLLLGFNLFVPSGYEIRIAEPGSKAGKGREPKGASASAEDPKLSEHHASEYGRKFAMKTALLAGLVYVLQRWQDACPTLILDCLYCLGLYSLLGVIEDGIGALFSASVLGIPVERSFDRFYFSANLAEFWSLRWNQHGEFDSAPPSSLDSSLTNRPPGAPPLSLSLSPSVAKLLKVVVYEPIVRGELVHKAKPKPPRSSLTKHTIKKALALLLTFVASGVMHEVVFAYGSGAGFTPNFGWFKFFSLQGVYVLAEQVVGRAVKSRPPKWVSIVGTLSFLLVTGDRHFFRAVREAGVDRAVVSNLHSLLS